RTRNHHARRGSGYRLAARARPAWRRGARALSRVDLSAPLRDRPWLRALFRGGRSPLRRHRLRADDASLATGVACARCSGNRTRWRRDCPAVSSLSRVVGVAVSNQYHHELSIRSSPSSGASLVATDVHRDLGLSLRRRPWPVSTKTTRTT